MARRTPRVALPPFALEYLESNPRARIAVQRFHIWLKASHRPLKQLEVRELEQFLALLVTSPSSASTRVLHARRARQYLAWLRERQLLSASPQSSAPSAAQRLPSLAALFIQTLEPTRKASTISGYRSTLIQFHAWLAELGRTPQQLTRQDLEGWLHSLHRQRLHPSSRIHLIQQVRAYLRWLDDRGDLISPADSLLRRSDLPKLPVYLPRPIPPDIDRILQKRLRSSRCRLQLGLLLMRNTGLRIGELIRLHHRCVRTDHRGNHFLKVPLGKLDNERLVPLDSKTLKILRRLQRAGHGHRQFLFESHGKPFPYYRFNAALRDACHGLSTPEPITSHRLRHTYATALLAGGMSTVAIMRLLGHRDYRMTLRYAAITDETIVTEFNEALRRNGERYAPAVLPRTPPSTDPLGHLGALIRLVQKRSIDASLDPARTLSLVRRIRRLQAGIKRHFASKSPRSSR